MVARNIVTPIAWPSGSTDGFIAAIEELVAAANGGVEGNDAIFAVQGNTVDVTLAGVFDYLSLVGQVLVLLAIDLTADVENELPVSSGGTGADNTSDARGNLELGSGDDVAFNKVNVDTDGYEVDGTKVVGAQESAIASLTDSSGGTAAATIVTIGDTSTSNEGSKINDNFATLNAKFDALLAADRSHGLIAT